MKINSCKQKKINKLILIMYNYLVDVIKNILLLNGKCQQLIFPWRISSIKSYESGNQAIKKLDEENITSFTLTKNIGRTSWVVSRHGDIICDFSFVINSELKDNISRLYTKIAGCKHSIDINDIEIKINPKDEKSYLVTCKEMSYPIPLIAIQYNEIEFGIEFNDNDINYEDTKNIEIICTYIYIQNSKRRELAHSSGYFGPDMKYAFGRRGLGINNNQPIQIPYNEKNIFLIYLMTDYINNPNLIKDFEI